METVYAFPPRLVITSCVFTVHYSVSVEGPRLDIMGQKSYFRDLEFIYFDWIGTCQSEVEKDSVDCNKCLNVLNLKLCAMYMTKLKIVFHNICM